MTTTAKRPAAPRVYTLPVVRELPAQPVEALGSARTW
jgi:hypothetical protein